MVNISGEHLLGNIEITLNLAVGKIAQVIAHAFHTMSCATICSTHDETEDCQKAVIGYAKACDLAVVKELNV